MLHTHVRLVGGLLATRCSLHASLPTPGHAERSGQGGHAPRSHPEASPSAPRRLLPQWHGQRLQHLVWLKKSAVSTPLQLLGLGVY